MSLPYRTPENLAKAKGDHEAIPQTPWARQSRHLSADRFPPTAQAEDDPDDKAGVLVSIIVGAALAVVVAGLIAAAPYLDAFIESLR